MFLPNWVGDAVMATPALRALRERFAGSHLCYLGRATPLETLAGLALPDETVTVPPGGGVWRLAGMLRKGDFDLAVLLPNSFRSALVARLGGVRWLAGYTRDARGWLLHITLSPPRDEAGRLVPVSAVDYYIGLAECLGAKCPSRRIGLAVTDDRAAQADKLLTDAGLADGRPLVMLNPGASYGVSKMWKPARYAALADELIDRRGAGVIINAAPSERKIARKVAAAMRHADALNLADRANSIGLVKALAARSALVVTNDTGARHIAAALGAAVVTLFGGTDPAWSAIDCDLERIVRVDVPCSPCQRKLCNQPPGPAYHQCMEAITVEMALSAAEELLDIKAGLREVCP